MPDQLFRFTPSHFECYFFFYDKIAKIDISFLLGSYCHYIAIILPKIPSEYLSESFLFLVPIQKIWILPPLITPKTSGSFKFYQILFLLDCLCAV